MKCRRLPRALFVIFYAIVQSDRLNLSFRIPSPRGVEKGASQTNREIVLVAGVFNGANVSTFPKYPRDPVNSFVGDPTARPLESSGCPHTRLSPVSWSTWTATSSPFVIPLTVEKITSGLPNSVLFRGALNASTGWPAGLPFKLMSRRFTVVLSLKKTTPVLSCRAMLAPSKPSK